MNTQHNKNICTEIFILLTEMRWIKQKRNLIKTSAAQFILCIYRYVDDGNCIFFGRIMENSNNLVFLVRCRYYIWEPIVWCNFSHFLFKLLSIKKVIYKLDLFQMHNNSLLYLYIIFYINKPICNIYWIDDLKILLIIWF